LIGSLRASAAVTLGRRLGVPQNRRICCPYRNWNLGPSSRSSDSSHTFKPGTFIRNAELQIAVLQMAVFGGAGGCVFCDKWVHVSTAWVLPQVAGGGTAFSMEGSGEYIE
jgi:hypothetical protein